MLLVGHEDLSLRGPLRPPRAHVTDDRDDGHEVERVEAALDPATDRILPLEGDPGQRLVDDGDARGVTGVSLGEVAAAPDRHAQRPEVIRRHHGEDRLRRARCRAAGRLGRLPASSRRSRRPGVGSPVTAADGADAGQSAQLRQQIAIERRRARRVFRRADRHGGAQHEEAFRREAHVHRGDGRETAREQAGADDEHDRERDLGDDERVARPAGARADRRALATLAQAVHELDARRLQRRRQTEQAARDERERDGEAERGACPRGSRRGAAGSRAPARSGRACRPARSTRRAAPTRRPARRSRSAAGGPGGRGPAPTAARTTISRSRDVARDEQQVRDVRARDEQHEADGAEQREQRAAGRPTIRSCSGTTSTSLPVLLCGYCPSSRVAIVSISARARFDATRRREAARSPGSCAPSATSSPA